MASTRNKNSRGDYCLEQRAFEQQIHYTTNQEYAFAPRTMNPGAGLLQGRLPDTSLSGNPKDIESFLFGIGSTNLVEPQAPVNPELKHLPELSIVDRKVPLIMPKELITEKDQRPFPIPN
jgi:hypothetical protein